MNDAMSKNQYFISISSIGESDLCKQVLKKLDHDGISKSLKNELIETDCSLNVAITQYFENCIIIEPLMENLKFQNRAKDFLPLKSNSANKARKISLDPFYLHLIKGYLSAEPLMSGEVMGITEDYIDKMLEENKKSLLEREQLNGLIEKKIDDFCHSLIEYSGYAERYKRNWKIAFQKAVAGVSSEADRLAIDDHEMLSDEVAINDLMLLYYEELTKGISMLKSLVLLYEKKIEFEFLLENIYTKKCSTLAAKINCFELNVLRSTYTKRTVIVLQKIRNQLAHKKAEIEEKLALTTAELEAYEILGSQYHTLVEEYTAIIAEIKHKNWSIEALINKMSLSDSVSEDVSIENNETSNSADCLT